MKTSDEKIDNTKGVTNILNDMIIPTITEGKTDKKLHGFSLVEDQTQRKKMLLTGNFTLDLFEKFLLLSENPLIDSMSRLEEPKAVRSGDLNLSKNFFKRKQRYMK